MKKTDRYFYPAVFGYEDGEEISVVFPDLDCATSGVDEADALLSARELLGCVLFGLEEDGFECCCRFSYHFKIQKSSGKRL